MLGDSDPGGLTQVGELVNVLEGSTVSVVESVSRLAADVGGGVEETVLTLSPPTVPPFTVQLISDSAVLVLTSV